MKVCLFSTYFDQSFHPHTIPYVRELSRHFDLTIVLYACNGNPSPTVFIGNNLRFIQVENSGMDFGMWMKGLTECSGMPIETLCLANDSCVALKPFDALMASYRSLECDLYGITQSVESFPHVQSYFMLLNEGAIETLSAIFATHGITNGYENVVNNYEVGLSRAVTLRGMKIGSLTEIGFNRALTDPFGIAKEGAPILKRFHLNSDYKADVDQYLRNNGLHGKGRLHLESATPDFAKHLEYMLC